jgi:hypothetical protein
LNLFDLFIKMTNSYGHLSLRGKWLLFL